MPHVDISSHITESLLSELRDRDWKVSIFIIIMFFVVGVLHRDVLMVMYYVGMTALAATFLNLDKKFAEFK
jgi:hypothetical protein